MDRYIPPYPTFDLAKAAQTALRQHYPEIQLDQPHILKMDERAVVMRCVSTHTPFASLMLKYSPDSPTTAFSEWAALDFLTTEGIAAMGVVPAFYGGVEYPNPFYDTRSPLIWFEDVGQGESFEAVLRRGDPTAIHYTLDRMGETMGVLAAQTLDNPFRFDTLRASYPDDGVIGRHPEARRWLGNRPKIEKWLAAFDLPVPPDFPALMSVIAHTFTEDWLAFSHGDPAPTNNMIVNDNVILLDFEYGAVRHLLYDLSAWYILCPLALPYVETVVNAFRRTLLPAFPPIEDNATFSNAWAQMIAFRGLAMLGWFSMTALAENMPWVGKWSQREALLATTGRLRQATVDLPAFGPITTVAARLWEKFQARWGEAFGEGLPRWD